MGKKKIIEKEIFVSELPKKNNGSNNIDWYKSIGCYVGFKFGDIIGEIKIINFKKDILSVTYLDSEIFKINTGNFKKCALGNLIGVVTSKFKIPVGKVILDEKRNMKITDSKYIVNEKGSNQKWYKYTCNRCGWTEGWIVESSLISSKVGCSCCANRTVVLGINSIWDTDRWMCDLGLSEEDAKKYTIEFPLSE